MVDLFIHKPLSVPDVMSSLYYLFSIKVKLRIFRFYIATIHGLDRAGEVLLQSPSHTRLS